MKKKGQSASGLLPTQAARSAGGLAHAKQLRRKKDKIVWGLAANYGEITGLKDLKFRPALLSLARITLLAERAYKVLKDRDSLLDDKGELCASIDVFRRLALGQLQMLEMCGLTPKSAREMAHWAERDLDLVGQLAKNVTVINGNEKPTAE
jgi:hypothetical protein